MTLAIVLLSITAWLSVGYLGGRKAAPIAYRRYRATWVEPYGGRDPVEKGQGNAAGAFTICLLTGPLGWVYVLAHSISEQTVPELRSARLASIEKAHREEIEAMQRQIDEAHKALGIAPLKREAAS